MPILLLLMVKMSKYIIDLDGNGQDDWRLMASLLVPTDASYSYSGKRGTADVPIVRIACGARCAYCS